MTDVGYSAEGAGNDANAITGGGLARGRVYILAL